MKHPAKLVGSVAALLLIFSLAAPASADTFIIDFTYKFDDSNAAPPAGTVPWLKATFLDLSGGGVSLTIDSGGLSGVEQITEVYFAIDFSTLPSDFAITHSSGVAPAAPSQNVDPIEIGLDAYKADGDGYFDILFSYPNNSTAFTKGLTSVYTIAGTGVDADDFDALSVNPNGGLLGAAHVQSTGSGGLDSAWIAGEEGTTPSFIPLPPAALSGLGLMAAAFFLRRRRR